MNTPADRRQIQRLQMLGVLAVSFAFLYPHIPSDYVSYGDSDELVGIALEGGLAHSPGYVYFVRLLQLLGTFGLDAIKHVHVFNAIVASGVIMLFFDLLKRIIQYLKLGISTQYIALITSLMLLFNGAFFEYSLFLEVFMLHLFLGLLVIWWYVAFISNNYSIHKHVLWWVLVGVFISHHQLSWLLLPFVIALESQSSYFSFKKLVLGLFVALCIFFLQIPLLLHIQDTSVLSWAAPSSYTQAFLYLFRQGYGTGGADAYLSTISLSQFAAGIRNFYAYTSDYSFAFLLILAFVGAYAGHLKTHRRDWKLFILLALSVLFPVFYLYMPQELYSFADHERAAITERMYLQTLPLLYMLVGVGISYLTSTMSRKPIFQVAVYTSITLLAYGGYTQLDVYSEPLNTTPIRDWAQVSLRDVPADSTIFCFSDITCFSLLLEKSIRRVSVDVVTLSSSLGDMPDKYAILGYPFSHAEYLGDLLDSGKNIYLSDLDGEFLQLLGLDGSRAYLRSDYPLFQVSCTSNTQDTSSDIGYRGVKYYDNISSYQKAFASFFAWNHGLHAQLLHREGHSQQALKHITAGLELDDSHSYLLSLSRQFESYVPDDEYGEELCHLDDETLITFYACIDSRGQCPTDILTQVMAYQDNEMSYPLLQRYFEASLDIKRASFYQ